MPEADSGRCRLCLVTPADSDADFVNRLGDALAGGDVASLIVGGSAPDLQPLGEALTPVAQTAGVAVLLCNDTTVAERVKADGVLIESGIDQLRTAVSALRPNGIVGAGGLRSRHQAMTAGEADPDFLFFGRLNGDTGPEIFPKALELAVWWSSMFVIPSMVMGGASIASVEQAAAAGIEFVALGRAVWEHPRGPGAAVSEANRRLDAFEEAVA